MPYIDDIIALELGQYRLRGQLAGSVYGLVWRASGPAGDVALKLVNAAQMERAAPALRQRWIDGALAEIALLRSMAPWDGCHIVRLLDSGWHAGLPVQALELLPGDLAQHVAAGGAPPWADCVAWLRQLNQALARLHQRGWRHLDLKPANVLLAPCRKRVKLADFGTARNLRALAEHSYCGTPRWQAPEQRSPSAGGGFATYPQTDYFALGALCFFLATGGALPGDDADADGAQAGARLRRADEERYAACLPAPALDAGLALLRALLAADPACRPRNALQISRLLASCANGEAPCWLAA